VSAAASEAGPGDSLTDCNCTLVKPSSAGDPVSVLLAVLDIEVSNIEVKDLAPPDRG
jgi:hypothetical protein